LTASSLIVDIVIGCIPFSGVSNMVGFHQMQTVWQNILAYASPASYLNGTAVHHTCSSDAIPYPQLPGAKILGLSATEVVNYSIQVPRIGAIGPADLRGLDFCNVTVTYTHPGQEDAIHVEVWLPSKWNGRFQGIGGGGYATGLSGLGLSSAISQGFAAASTDGGHVVNFTSAEDWALVSPGNVNLYLFQNFASVALHDMTVIGKWVTETFYGTAPKYAYWNGCSTGGRQGLMLAQRYPKDYDGILALAPAINWVRFVVAEFWPQLVMNLLGVYPEQCEFQAITAAAIQACDALDGLTDGVISAPKLCHFNPHTLVGRTYNCNGVNKIFTDGAATIAEAAWEGPRSVTGSFQWYGINKDASFAIASTSCSDSVCTGAPFSITTDWIRLFIKKNPDFDVRTITHEQYDAILHASIIEYTSFIDTSDADLSSFRAAGGKMITWHGLVDPLIFPNGTSEYYEHVLQHDPDARDFYRFFEVPGTLHCSDGPGPFPKDTLGSLVRWVEEGVAPNVLEATSLTDGVEIRRDLCQYPLVSRYNGGDPTRASSFVCAESFA
jgi:hypothetical protein